jgi:uncharacterized protein
MLQPVEIDPRRFTQGALFCRVTGRADQLGSLSLALTVHGQVELTCQRCLGGMQHTVEIDRMVYLARSETELDRLDALPDSDAILVGETLGLVELVEDEVLLGLPLAPMHAEGQCPV